MDGAPAGRDGSSLTSRRADAATRIEDLVGAGAPDDHVIMTISIRR